MELKNITNMTDETMSRLYFIVYFWCFLATQTLLVMFGTELDSPRGIINTVITYMAFIPFYGYVMNKIFPTKYFWRLLIVLFFLWQIAGYSLFYDHPPTVKIAQLLMLAPFYWGTALYALVITEENQEKKHARILKIKAFEEKFRSIRVITCAFSLLLLGLSLFIMVAGQLNNSGTPV